MTGAEWPPANQPKSPCPTLKVIGAITAYQNKKEELKRMKQGPGMVAGKGIVISAAAKTVDAGGSILLLPLRVLQRVLLGKLPEKATSGSFQETKVKRRGGLLTFWRRQPEVVQVEVEEEEVVEDELDPRGRGEPAFEG